MDLDVYLFIKFKNNAVCGEPRSAEAGCRRGRRNHPSSRDELLLDGADVDQMVSCSAGMPPGIQDLQKGHRKNVPKTIADAKSGHPNRRKEGSVLENKVTEAYQVNFLAIRI